MEFAKYIVQRSVATKHITNFSLRNQLGIGEDREFYNPYRDEDMPDKSLKFAKERISSSAFVCLENIEEKMQRIPYSMVRREKIENKLAFGYKTMHISVLYNPEAEFDYLSSASCRCDGTLTFAFDLCDEIIVNLLSGKSCYEFKKPKDLDISPWNYDVEFEVGDFVFVEEYGKQFSTKEKPWMTSRFTVMLPVKCDFKKR